MGNPLRRREREGEGAFGHLRNPVISMSVTGHRASAPEGPQAAQFTDLEASVALTSALKGPGQKQEARAQALGSPAP